MAGVIGLHVPLVVVERDGPLAPEEILRIGMQTAQGLAAAHAALAAGSDMLRKISAGWPRVLSSLKSLLETGKPLPTWAK